MPISVRFSAPEFHTWRRIKKWPANVTNMNTNTATTAAVNMNTANTTMATVMMTVAAVMNITNIITTIATMTIATATNTAAIATKAVPAMAEKTVMKSKKNL